MVAAGAEVAVVAAGAEVAVVAAAGVGVEEVAVVAAGVEEAVAPEPGRSCRQRAGPTSPLPSTTCRTSR
jgi:hypothetical protein